MPPTAPGMDGDGMPPPGDEEGDEPGMDGDGMPPPGEADGDEGMEGDGMPPPPPHAGEAISAHMAEYADES